MVTPQTQRGEVFEWYKFHSKNLKKGIDLEHEIGSDRTVNMRLRNACYGFIKARIACRKQGD